MARADAGALAAAVRALREGDRADAVVVSYHGGAEYTDALLARAREILHAAVDAGADAALGHHPHVVQGVEWYRRRPILAAISAPLGGTAIGAPGADGCARLEPPA